VLLHAAHHLVGAGRLRLLGELLLCPEWLERKLHACGAAAIVADCRKCVVSMALACSC
jgi:hypothetical protein